MSAFVATDPAVTEAAITNNGFYPDIEPGTCRNAMRISGSITPDRLRHSLIASIQQVNNDLALWMQTQQLAGHASLADVPADQIEQTSVKLFQYERAVYNATKAELTERRPDYDSTQKGLDRSNSLSDLIDQYRRAATVATRQVMDKPSSTIELI